MQHRDFFIRQDIDFQRRVFDNRRHAENMQLHREKVMSVKRPIMWRRLVDRIAGVIMMQKSFSAANPNLAINMKAEPGSGEFRLDHPAYPKARVFVKFTNEMLIELHCSYQKTDESRQIEWGDLIGFSVDENDNVHLSHDGEIISVDDAALLILKPVRDPAFVPPGD